MIRSSFLLPLAILSAACATSKEAAADPAFNAVRSDRNFEETLAAARTAIEARGFKIVAVIDHAAAAAAVGDTLPPTTLIVFGNAKGGTPLMRAAPGIAIDLPLKALVSEGPDQAVTIATQNIDALFAEHGVKGMDAEGAAMTAALRTISEEAAGR